MKYIEIKVEKRYQGKVFINRFMHLLNLISGNRYDLNDIHSLASIEDKRTGLTVAQFSDNPFLI